MTYTEPTDNYMTLTGMFCFKGVWAGITVKDSYELCIEVPPYPHELPRVYEIGGRIPRCADRHVYERTGQLCLGSPLRLRQILGPSLDLVLFADQCLVPYLYASTRREVEGVFVFGELSHGIQGLLSDYEDILGVRGVSKVRAALQLLATTPSIANHKTCPCGCERLLSECEFRSRLSEIRQLATPEVFRSMELELRRASGESL